jgi:hypothetical protein
MKHDKWPDMQANMGRMQEIAQQLLQFGLGLAQTLVPAAQGMRPREQRAIALIAQHGTQRRSVMSVHGYGHGKDATAVWEVGLR